LKEQTRKHLTKAGWLLFYLYIIVLAYFLFFSERYGRDIMTHGYRYNLVLFKEIKRFIKYWRQLGIETVFVNLFGNVLAFAPFGFLLPLLDKKYRRFFYVTFLSMLFSLTIELIQLFLRVGICDVDDVFLNTVGGIVGYIFFAFCNRFFCKMKKHRNKSKK